jgi:type II secretory pathway pseudopilin PulG
MKKSSITNMVDEQGLSLVELLVYIAIVGIVLAAIYTTFLRQQDSYLIQERLAILQQNLRGAMAMIASDLEMAGYYTCYEQKRMKLDWDDDGTDEEIRPLLLGTNNSIVIVRVDPDRIKRLETGEGVNAGSNTINVDTTSLGFDTTTDPYGLLIKSDLSRAEFFEVTSVGAGSLTVNIPDIDPVSTGFIESYFTGGDPTDPLDPRKDLIAPVEIITYSVDADNNLLRSGTIVAEHIKDIDGVEDGLELLYGVAYNMPPSTAAFGWETTTLGGVFFDERNVREVSVTLRGEIEVSTKLGRKERTLSSTIKVRNLGMEMM